MARKKTVLPSKDVLNSKDLENLSSPRLSRRFRAYEKLYRECNFNLSTTIEFLKKYYPQFSLNRKTLRKYLDTVYFAQRLSKKFDGILTEEEITRYLYILAKRKLRRNINEPLALGDD